MMTVGSAGGWRRVLVSVTCVVAVAACGQPNGTASGAPVSRATASSAVPTATASGTTPAVSSTASSIEATPTLAPHLRLVAIGDSLAQGAASSCPGCTDYVDLFGQAISSATGIPVDVDNRAAIEFSALPPVQATQLLNNILTDASLRTAIAAADIIVVSVGFNDTPWNRADDPCDASNPDLTVVRWNRITPECIARVTHEYKQTLDEIVTQIDELRGCFTPPGQPSDFCPRAGRNTTLLRLVTVCDDWIGEQGTPAAALASTEAADRSFVDAQCWVIHLHGGQCADAYHVLNGPAGTADAAPFLVDDHTHLNQRGHQRIADILTKLGIVPLVPRP